MADLFLTEKDAYGDLQFTGADIAVAWGYENLPFLSLFGGASWWGNRLLTLESERFMCQTEVALQSVALNSAGRLKIEAAIKADLKHITDNVPGTVISVQTYVESDDRLRIKIGIDGALWIFEWNPGAYGLPKGRIIFDNQVFTEQFTSSFK